MLSPTDPRLDQIRAKAGAVRRHAIKMVYRAKLGHPGGDMSVADILATLYFGVLKLDPANPSDPARDRFVLSKGHCSGAFYATLAERGFIPVCDLESYMKPLSLLNGHPNRNYVPGVEANTGPLGHGLPIAVGMAIAGRLDAASYRVFVVVGDGELQEGSNWEAAMTAAHGGLGNLTLIVDRNRLQQGATTQETSALEPLADKWRAFGWDVCECDGHDHAALLEVLDATPGARPRCVIAHTHKGKGVSYMEDQVSWHHGIPNAEQFEIAMRELA